MAVFGWTTGHRRIPLLFRKLRLRAAIFTSPVSRPDDDVRSSFASSESSWVASRCLEAPRLVYVISHGNRRTKFSIFNNANVCRLLIRPSGVKQGRHDAPQLDNSWEKIGIAGSLFGRCFPIGVVKVVKYMNVRASVWTCQLRLHFHSGYDTLPQVTQGTGIEWWLYALAVIVPPVSKTPRALILFACGRPFYPGRLVAQNRVPSDRYRQCIPSRALGSAVDRWVAEWCPCHASRKGLSLTMRVERVEPLPTRGT